YEDYRGEITAEKINHLLSVYQPLADATADMTASTAKDNRLKSGDPACDGEARGCLCHHSCGREERDECNEVFHK
uniref:hypothetical protein n=1 Tax=uncultured Duncaniella sp. TaxID=2768039 RepID=UPI00266FCAC3